MFCQVVNYFNMQDKQFTSLFPSHPHSCSFTHCNNFLYLFLPLPLNPILQKKISLLIFSSNQEKALTNPTQILLFPHQPVSSCHSTDSFSFSKFVQGFMPLFTGCCEGHVTTKESTSPQEQRPSKVFCEIKQYEPNLTYCYSKMVSQEAAVGWINALGMGNMLPFPQGLFGSQWVFFNLTQYEEKRRHRLTFTQNKQTEHISKSCCALRIYFCLH